MPVPAPSRIPADPPFLNLIACYRVARLLQQEHQNLTRLFLQLEPQPSSEIWKIRPDGSSEVQVTKDGGAIAVESVDGKFLYYKTRGDQSELWKCRWKAAPQL